MTYKEKLVKSDKITILALSWRDIMSPTAGGAEVHTHELLKRLDGNKFRVIHFAALYENEREAEVIDNIQYIRKGNIGSVIFYSFLYYSKNKDAIDFVIDQCNTHRFFTPLWVNSQKRIFCIHQLTREIWDINLPFPLSKIGKSFENTMLKLNRNDHTIALSESTKEDLLTVGFKEDKIVIIPPGMSFAPWKWNEMLDKEKRPTFIYVGRYAKYKGIDAAIEAIGMLKKKYKDVQLWILGKKDTKYVEKELEPICRRYNIVWGETALEADVVSWGFVTEEKKLELLSRATALVFPSIREGWGIPVTEAGNVGTPSIVYDAPGIRDAVDMGDAGYLCHENNAIGLYEKMEQVITEEEQYEDMRKRAYRFSSQFVWEQLDNKLEEFIGSIKDV